MPSGSGAPPKKRTKKPPKPEPDYDTFIANLIAELRRLPALAILEPDIPPDFNFVPVFGSGNMNVTGELPFSSPYSRPRRSRK